MQLIALYIFRPQTPFHAVTRVPQVLVLRLDAIFETFFFTFFAELSPTSTQKNNRRVLGFAYASLIDQLITNSSAPRMVLFGLHQKCL